MTLTAIQEALEPVVRMLAVEDYHLSVTGGDEAIQLEITAGEAACSYCLVSKTTLRSIAQEHMTKAGLPDIPEIGVIYPDDASGT
jgi:chemotaxis response regulator CheB